jgi:hypothetical protein
MDPNESYEKIVVLLGDEKLTFQGTIIGTMPPLTRNGNVNNQLVNSDGTISTGASNILLAFPLHLRLSYLGDVLYFSEAYPTTTDGQYLFGSLTIRRYKLDTGEVDTYAGVDFTSNPSNESYYQLIGSMGGSIDGTITTAQFKYPMSISVMPTNSELVGKESKNNKNNEGEGGFHVLYVADQSNSVIRKIYPTMYTPSPTHSPTTLHPPSASPTTLPTLMKISSSTRLSNSFKDLPPYEQVLILSSTLIFGLFCCCYCCFHFITHTTTTTEMKVTNFDFDDLESSNSRLFHSPSSINQQSSSLKEYFAERWHRLKHPFVQNHSHRLHPTQHLSKRQGVNVSTSDDGRNGLLDVSMSSTTSSIENEEWDEVIWNRTPNLNISKQYRLSGSKWPPSPPERSPSNGTQCESTVPWSTVTPIHGEMSTSRGTAVAADISSAAQPEPPGSLSASPPQRTSSFLSRLTSWWTSSQPSQDSSHSSEHEIQLNDSSRQSPPKTSHPETPRAAVRKWNSSKWDQVDDSMVAMQFDEVAGDF